MIGVGTGWVVRNGPMVYDVLLPGEKTMKVVRVSACPLNGSLTIHLAVPLFRKRFNTNKKQAPRRRS